MRLIFNFELRLNCEFWDILCGLFLICAWWSFNNLTWIYFCDLFINMSSLKLISLIFKIKDQGKDHPYFFCITSLYVFFKDFYQVHISCTWMYDRTTGCFNFHSLGKCNVVISVIALNLKVFKKLKKQNYSI